MAVSQIQTIRNSLLLLDELYLEMNEETLEALRTNPDYKSIEYWSSHLIEFKVEKEITLGEFVKGAHKNWGVQDEM